MIRAEFVEEILGITNEDWFPQQPVPTSDCNFDSSDELEHYAMLHETGECPHCEQKEVSV